MTTESKVILKSAIAIKPILINSNQDNPTDFINKLV